MVRTIYISKYQLYLNGTYHLCTVRTSYVRTYHLCTIYVPVKYHLSAKLCSILRVNIANTAQMEIGRRYVRYISGT